jgi:hypothetical protein
MKRLLAVVLAAGVALLVASAPASAFNDEAFNFDRAGYRPGDEAIGRAGVNWEGNLLYGTPVDGPYYVYALPLGIGPTYDEAGLPIIPADARRIDDIEIRNEPINSYPGYEVGPYSAIVQFNIPDDMAPGTYKIVHCNDPCTKRLGNLTDSEFTVLAAGDELPDYLAGPIGPVVTTVPVPTQPPVTKQLPQRENVELEHEEGNVGAAVAFGLVVVLLAGGAWFGATRWRRKRAERAPATKAEQPTEPTEPTEATEPAERAAD